VIVVSSNPGRNVEVETARYYLPAGCTPIALDEATRNRLDRIRADEVYLAVGSPARDSRRPVSGTGWALPIPWGRGQETRLPALDRRGLIDGVGRPALSARRRALAPRALLGLKRLAGRELIVPGSWFFRAGSGWAWQPARHDVRGPAPAPVG